MARKLYVEEADRETMLDLFLKKFGELCGKKSSKSSETINIKEIFTSTKTAVLTFSRTAWLKMTALVMACRQEIGWHGTVERTEDGFIVTDIIVFPQEVTSSTVTPDQTQYNAWLNSLSDDIFNHMRFHGHSHVNMGVTPSSVDTGFRKSILDNMQTDPEDGNWFYIFMIINKNLDIEAEIYDMDNNIMYNHNDLLIDVELEDGDKLCQFVDESKLLVKKYAAPKSNPQSVYYGKYVPPYKQKTVFESIKEEQIKEEAKNKTYPKSAVDDKPSEEELRELYGAYYMD